MDRRHKITLLLALLVLSVPVAGFAQELPIALSRAIDQYLEGQWQDADVLWILERNQSIPQLTGYDSFSVDSGEMPRGNTILRIELFRDGDIIKRVPLKLVVTPVAWVPVASIQLSRNDVLSNMNIRWEKRDVTRIRGKWLRNTTLLSNSEYWVTRRINAGDPILLSDIEEKPDILIGDQVTLVAEKGSVTISMPGIALQDGKEGDTIRLRNPVYDSIVSGKVVGEKKVVVQRVERYGRDGSRSR